jgi:hypothetical protein
MNKYLCILAVLAIFITGCHRRTNRYPQTQSNTYQSTYQPESNPEPNTTEQLYVCYYVPEEIKFPQGITPPEALQVDCNSQQPLYPSAFKRELAKIEASIQRVYSNNNPEIENPHYPVTSDNPKPIWDFSDFENDLTLGPDGLPDPDKMDEMDNYRRDRDEKLNQESKIIWDDFKRKQIATCKNLCRGFDNSAKCIAQCDDI